MMLAPRARAARMRAAQALVSASWWALSGFGAASGWIRMSSALVRLARCASGRTFKRLRSRGCVIMVT